MTISELQTYRTSLLTALTNGGVVISYGTNGRQVTRMSPKEIYDLINRVDADIARLGSGMFAAAQFRTSGMRTGRR